jgi:ATP-dependent Lon protease
MKTGSLKVTG